MVVSDMKKFIIHLLIFFGIVVAMDMLVGKVFWYLQSTKAGGRTGSEYYACMESNEDVIIMGSSRASHHYVPQIITDSLGLSCFNAGQDGNGIILQYGRWKMISERYKPKLIIYDVTRGFDLEEGDNMRYIDRLKPFCSNKEVTDYVASLFPMERVKLLSQLYRYNYKFLEILSDCTKRGNDNLRGYIPLKGTVRQEAVDRAKENVSEPKDVHLDATKLTYLEQLSCECEKSGVKLVFVVSPYFAGGAADENTFYPVEEIAHKHGAIYFYFNDSSHCWQTDKFKDTSHLNDDGARDLTAELVRKLAI